MAGSSAAGAGAVGVEAEAGVAVVVGAVAVVAVDFPAAVEVLAEEAPDLAGDMKASEFLNRLEHDAIVNEIRHAESKMCGEIRVFISRKMIDDAVSSAQKAFHHLGMEKTKEKNGVLIFVAPRVRKFAVIGDSAIHERCGDSFWKEVTHEMSLYFGRGEFTGGILHGVRRAGQLMAEHFPRHPGDKNEQPDDIAHD